MKYISTRGRSPATDFEGATLAGLAPDGGLYVPAYWPRLSVSALRRLTTASFSETAAVVLRPLIGDSLPTDILHEICHSVYIRFRHEAVTPLVQMDSQHWMLELHHGPTLAFKDMALQWLGAVLDFFLKRNGQKLMVIGATSGDTGSAAIEALAGHANITVFILHPAGRVSEVQRRQMTTVLSPNVHNIAIEGSFDDAQAIVKVLFADPELRARSTVSAINSINWARIAAQTVYYFYAAMRLGAPYRHVAFSVPTGNFGDVYAGYVAMRMGLQVRRLIVATNANDILHRAFTAGDYSRGAVVPTEAPSMDIQVSSNFERLLFHLSGNHGPATARRMAQFASSGAIQISPAMQARAARMFSSHSVDADTMRETMRWAHDACGMVIDPHSAIGLGAARALTPMIGDGTPIITLATAHPAKFRESVERATGGRPGLPAHLAGLFDRQERYVTVPASVDAVRNWILDTKIA